MRVTLVYHGRYLVRQALELETLASVIRTGGHHAELVYDADTFGLTDNVLQILRLARLLSSPARVVQRIAASGPDVLLFSVLPGTYAWARRIAPLVKEKLTAPIVFMGLHPTLVPERVMRDSFVDYVLQGEVENVIHPLLEAIGAGGEVGAVGNLWYRHGGRLRKTPQAELVDLDALPLPDKDLFRPYVSHSFSYPAMVSRGCPYQCTFCEETCSKRLYHGKYYRRKNVQSVMAELRAGKRKYHFREVIFKDSYLSGNKEWLAALMDRYRREISVPFKCFCTIHGFDGETARLLKEGGCYSVEFGLQTWNSRIRREVLSRTETNAEALRVFEHCADQKLWYDVDHMFNLPYETPRDHLEGALHYRDLRYLNRIKVHFLVYLPAAAVVDHGLAAQVLPPDARERLADGWESDFYDQTTGSEEQRLTVAGFAALYKLLPVVPGGLLRWLMRGDRVKRLGHIPSPIMALLQGLLALRSGDLRFLAYLSVYPARVSRTILAGLFCS